MGCVYDIWKFPYSQSNALESMIHGIKFSNYKSKAL